MKNILLSIDGTEYILKTNEIIKINNVDVPIKVKKHIEKIGKIKQIKLKKEKEFQDIKSKYENEKMKLKSDLKSLEEEFNNIYFREYRACTKQEFSKKIEKSFKTIMNKIQRPNKFEFGMPVNDVKYDKINNKIVVNIGVHSKKCPDVKSSGFLYRKNNGMIGVKDEYMSHFLVENYSKDSLLYTNYNIMEKVINLLNEKEDKFSIKLSSDVDISDDSFVFMSIKVVYDIKTNKLNNNLFHKLNESFSILVRNHLYYDIVS